APGGRPGRPPLVGVSDRSRSGHACRHRRGQRRRHPEDQEPRRRRQLRTNRGTDPLGARGPDVIFFRPHRCIANYNPEKEHIMPILNVKISRTPSPQLTAAVAGALLERTVGILHKKRDLTSIAIEYVPPEHWVVGG